MRTYRLGKFVVLGSLALSVSAADASYYRLFGRANEQIFFGPMDDQQVDQTNGIKRFSAEAKGETQSDYAVGRINVRFGSHAGACLAQGLFSNAYAEARTEEDVTFYGPNGSNVLVQVNLVGAAAVAHPDTVSVQRADSSLAVNGVVRVGYLDQYIGNSHQVNAPQPYVFEVAHGATIRLFHKTIFQISGTGSDKLYFVSCNGGIQAEVKVMTPGAKMSSSSGSRYLPLIFRGTGA